MINRLKERACKFKGAYNAEVVSVQGNLTITPSQMSQLAERGIPISSQMLGADNFDDGEVGVLSEVPFTMRRGVDASDVYVYQQKCRKKVNDYVQSQQPD